MNPEGSMFMKLNARTAALAFAACLAGCAGPARVEQMQVDTSLSARTAVANSALKDNVAIKDVTGGSDTNPLWISKVSSTEFERALETSLRSAGLLAGRQAGTHLLTAHMVRLDQPMFGASMTVTASVEYTLVERASGKTVYSHLVAVPYTAGWSDAFLGAERLKLANEGAMRENLRALIADLVALKVGPVSVKP